MNFLTGIHFFNFKKVKTKEGRVQALGYWKISVRGNKMPKGKIILIESGTDGAGKKTQADKMTKWLKEQGVNVRQISYPRYEKASSVLVKQYLNGNFGAVGDVTPYQASSFYMVDRLASYLEDWKTFYEQDGVLILDRYVTSNMIYQGAKIKDPQERKDFLAWLYEAEYKHNKLPQPDVTLYLDVSPEIAESMRTGRELKAGTEKDIHEENSLFMLDCYKVGKELAQNYNWHTIQCVEGTELLDIETIHNLCKQVVKGQGGVQELEHSTKGTVLRNV